MHNVYIYRHNVSYICIMYIHNIHNVLYIIHNIYTYVYILHIIYYTLYDYNVYYIII